MFISSIKAIRGAVLVEKNSVESVDKAISTFFAEFFRINKISQNNIISCLISTGLKINSIYPCTLIRKAGYSFPCLSFGDQFVQDTPQMVIRFLFHCSSWKKLQDIYIGELINLKHHFDNNSSSIAKTHKKTVSIENK